MKVIGKFTGLHIRRHRLIGKIETPNSVVDDGLDRILDVMFNSGAQSANWYAGILDTANTLDNSDTMSSHPGWIEFTDYSEATRPQWVPSSEGIGIISNSSYMDFNITAGPNSIHGVFIVDENTKSGTTGNLWSTAKFTNGLKSVENGDLIRIVYTLQAGR